jgi:hypothetical protein
MSPLLLAAEFIGTVVVVLLAFEGGRRLGQWRSRHPDAESHQTMVSLVSSILSLCAFILGFAFGFASAHFDSRNQAVFDEAIAIGTAYRRADLLLDPERTAVRRLLREYVDLRLQAGRSTTTTDLVGQLRHLQKEIWAHAVAVSRKEAGSSATPFIQSVTEVDVQAERVLAGVRSRISFTVWTVLYAIMVTAVCAAGYQSGLASARRSLAAVFYAVVFAAVTTMVAAADVPGSQQIQASHQALSDLRARLGTPSDAALDYDHGDAGVDRRSGSGGDGGHRRPVPRRGP